MSTTAKKRKTNARRGSQAIAAKRSGTGLPTARLAPTARRKTLSEAEATLSAIRAGQIDALVIQSEESEKVYALRTFVELEQTQTALKTAGLERRRSRAQLQALAEEKERLFQDMHDSCIQSIYAVGLNLEACMRVIEVSPKKAAEMIADATVSLSLVVQELRSFIIGHKLQIADGYDLRSEIEKAVQTACNHGVTFTVDIDENAMRALTSEQALHMLQIAREGISNATRHANAQTGLVSLRKRRGAVCLEVRDDGTGFIVKKVNKLGLGLHHIDARARKMGGTARVYSAPHQGTRIVVKLGKSR
jgi:signal transduction histidine kinase